MASASNLENNNFKIPNVFGSNAAYKTAPNDFPSNTPTNSVKASWLNGFPEQTFQPNNAPSGADFNGLFGLLSGLLMNTQMGQMINTYDATYQGNIGGYPNGAIIWFVPNGDWSNRMLFQSIIDNNTNVPYNTTTQSVGTGWKQLLPAKSYQFGLDFQGATVPNYTQLINWNYTGQTNWRFQNNNYIDNNLNPNGYYTVSIMPLIEPFTNYDEIIFIYDAWGLPSPDLAMRAIPTWQLNMMLGYGNLAQSFSLSTGKQNPPLIARYNTGDWSSNTSYFRFLAGSSHYTVPMLAILGIKYE